jgi:hypothetical protein
MAKFTLQEVSALQGGGNASAKEIYFKEWDPQRQSTPDSSNVEKLRDFIKHLYVDRRYTGERSYDKPPRAKTGDSEDVIENRSVGSRSPPYEDTYDRRYTGRSDERNYKNNNSNNDDRRSSPGYDSDYRKSPSNVVNDWRREDRFGNGRKSEDKFEGRSPDSQSDGDLASPPVVRPVRDILGENVSLRVIEPPKSNGAKSTDASVRTQRSVSSSSLASSNGNPTELKTESSLIDFDAIPDPPPVAQEPATVSASNNWANFDSFSSDVKASQGPSNVNFLDSVLSELSVPSSSLPATGSAGNMSAPPFGSAQVSNSLPVTGPASQGLNSLFDGGQWQTPNPQQQFPYNAPVSQNHGQLFTPVLGGASTNQTWNSTMNPHVQNPSGVAATNLPQSPPLEPKPTEKKELPADLFSMNYPHYQMPAPGWQPVQAYGYNMQYAPTMPTYPQSSRSTNPFDLGGDMAPAQGQAPAQVTMFPSMGSLQGALPNMGTGLLRTSSAGTPPPSQTWMPMPMPMPIHPQQSYASPMPPGSYMGQQIPPTMPPRQQGGMGYGSFNQPIQQQHQTGLYSKPADTPDAFSSLGGNPFG